MYHSNPRKTDELKEGQHNQFKVFKDYSIDLAAFSNPVLEIRIFETRKISSLFTPDCLRARPSAASLLYA